MAERRMFAKTIVLSDAFLDMPMSARCLYFTLGMLADDDGFINSPRSIMRQCGASDDDMKLLIAKKFVLVFDTGVIVIKHWRINNYLRNDRYKETAYLEEKEHLSVNDNGSYTLGIPNNGIPSGIPTVYPVKDSIGKDSIGKDIYIDDKPKQKRFVKPTLQEVEDYIKEKNYTIDAEHFFNHYESNGWKVGNSPMKNWKAAIATWQKNDGIYGKRYSKKEDILPEYMNNPKKENEEKRNVSDIQKMIESL